jgi:hypothetical protein
MSDNEANPSGKPAGRPPWNNSKRLECCGVGT